METDEEKVLLLISETIFIGDIFFFCSNSREVTAKVISPQFLTCLVKFKTSYMIRTAWRTAARNPGEITISLAFVCGEPSCIQKHSSPLRFLFLLYCTSICMQRGPLACHLQVFIQANKVFMTQDFAFWYVTPVLFNSSQAGVGAVMSKFKKKGMETEQECRCHEFSVCLFTGYRAIHIKHPPDSWQTTASETMGGVTIARSWADTGRCIKCIWFHA